MDHASDSNTFTILFLLTFFAAAGMFVIHAI